MSRHLTMSPRRATDPRRWWRSHGLRRSYGVLFAHVPRRGPGRPRKLQVGDTVVTPAAEPRVNSGPERGALASEAIVPRLLDLQGTARYLGVSTWTVRDLEAAGVLKRVCVPLPGRDLRKLLFDRAELDRLIETWKE